MKARSASVANYNVTFNCHLRYSMVQKRCVLVPSKFYTLLCSGDVTALGQL